MGGDEHCDFPEDAPEGCDKKEVAEAVRVLGNAAFKAGDLDKALLKYDKAMRYLALVEESDEVQNSKISCLSNAALCLSQKKCLAECVAKCDEALAIKADNVKVLFRRGSVRLQMNDPEGAE